MPISYIPPGARCLSYHPEDSIVVCRSDVTHAGLHTVFLGFASFVFSGLGCVKGEGAIVLSLFQSLASYWKPVFVQDNREFMGEDHLGPYYSVDLEEVNVLTTLRSRSDGP